MVNHSEETPDFFRRDDGESEVGERFEALASSLADGVYELDTDGRFVAVNDVLFETFGYDRSDLLGEHVSVLLDEGGRTHFENVVETLRGGSGAIATLELTLERADGGSVPCELQCSALRADGEFRGTVGVVRDATGGRETADSLERSEGAHARLVENVPGVVYRCRNEPGWPMEFLSDGCTELTGYDPEEFVSGARRWEKDVIHPDDADRVRAEVRRGVERGETFTVEYRIRTADGETRWVAERGRAVEPDGGESADGDAEPAALEGVVTDITERKRTEKELRDRETEVRSLVEAVEGYALVRLDVEGYVESWNSGAERMAGYERDDIVGEHVSTFYTDDDVEAGVPDRTLVAAAETGRAEHEGWFVREDGSTFWADVTVTAIRDGEGELQGFATVARDMTERRRRERQLREERDLRDRVFETSPVGIAIFDPDGRLAKANERMAELLDLSTDAFDGYEMGDREFFDEDGEPLPYDRRPGVRVIETGEPVSDQRVRVATPEGGTRWLSINATPLTDDDGGLSYVVATVTDITQLEEQTRRLSRRRDELESELADVFDRVTDAFYALDEEWRFTHVNDRAEEMLERDASELLGARIWDEFEHAANSPFRAQYERAMERQESVTFEHYSPSIDAWFEVRAYPSETGLSVYFRDVTDRKERQHELEEYETIVETVGDGVYVLDEEGRFRRMNDACAEITGYDRGELYGSHYSLVVGEDVTERIAEFEAAIAAGEVKNKRMEFEIRRRDGGTLPVESTFTPLVSDGEFRGTVGVVRDISERKERERELERYEQLVETVWDGLYALDPDDRIVLANEAMCELTGYDREELLGERPTLITSAEVNRAANELQDEMLSGGETEGALQFDIHRKDGETVPAEARLGPYEYDDGVYGRCGVIRDVTERKQFEETLTALHESSRAFLNAVSDDDVGEIIIDAATDVLDLSGVVVYRYDEAADHLVADAKSVKAGISAHEFPPVADRDGSLIGHIFSTDEAKYYDDIRESPTLQVDRTMTRVRSGFGVPMGDYGVLAVGSTESDVLDEQTRELVEVLAANAEAAYARVEHESELHERVRQQNVVADLGQRALSEHDIDALAQNVAETVAETLDMDYCGVLDLQPDGENLLLRGGVGWGEDVVGSALTEADENRQAGYTLRSAGPVIVDDFDDETRFENPAFEEYGVKSGMTVVVGSQDDPWGVLGVHDTERRQFTERDANFLQSVAYVLAAAIDRRTYERELVDQRAELQKREQTLRNAYEVIADPDLSFDERIDDLLRIVREAVGTEYATLSRVHEDEYVFEAIDTSSEAGFKPGDSIPLSATNCERVVEMERTLVLRDVATDAPELADRAGNAEWGITNYLGAPVLVDGEVYGTFCFYGTDERTEKFTDWEATFVDILSNWVGNEFERQRNTDRLTALNSLNEVVRETTEAVIEQSTREEIEKTVCEALAESESYEFAWVGAVARGGDEVYVRQEAGVENYLEGTRISVDEDHPSGRGPTGRAFRTQEIQVVRNVMNDPAYEEWRARAEEYGYQSSASIPIVHEGVVYGTLNVYAARPDAFADEEQEVIGQLGEIVGHAIAAVERKRALTSDQIIEVEFEIPDVFSELDIPAGTDEEIVLEQAVPTDHDDYLVYGTTTEGGVEAIETIVESVPHWASVRVVGDDVGRVRFEARLEEPPVLMAMASLGGYVHQAQIRDGDYQMAVHLPVGTDVRDAIERVQSAYPAARVRAQRQRDRTERGPNRIVSALNEELTDRQRSVLESAYFSGFFEWPRESSGQEVANSLGISAPTFSQHIRSAENKIFGALFERSGTVH
ncbi:PAS domain S-box protein [Halopelagius longus]|uniref:PAS domain S-box protein n=1 Tax=Halopelagius longus TaxID=1236180 RepID=A0A1H1BL21_9EURY|nr:PAS domain S-box protein [Halopelagius longus]RDI70827.1 PAS domain S-box protein [Halopelagius longus]SDQ52607.1 PAS domain S-box-containing protein [Halopelagius longus]